MSRIYILRVYDENDIYEYEFGNLPHAVEQQQAEPLKSEIWIADTKVLPMSRTIEFCTVENSGRR
jgi:hypothetical protein